MPEPSRTTLFLHPDCPDLLRTRTPPEPEPETGPAGGSGVPRPRTAAELARHGPTLPEAALRVRAEAVRAELTAQREKWRFGFTRRRALAGAGAVAVAALGSQLVTTRVAFGAPNTTRTLITIFLRGGMDGLAVIVPAGDRNLADARRNIAVPAAALLPGDDRFGLHPALKPLHPLWTGGKMAAVHAVASPDLSRSHFQAQDCLERGAASTAVHTGWLDRVLSALGPGTTFRAVAQGSALPRSLVGGQDKVVLRAIQDFRLDGVDGYRGRTMTAIKSLYTGLDHPVTEQAKITLDALAKARKIASDEYRPSVEYPGGGFANELRNVARLIKAKAGVRVVAMDVGGWDMHTNLGRVDGGDMRNLLTEMSTALAAFASDLGPLLDDVTIVTMSEFGRRVEENGNAGTDHGHGGLMMLLGGGLNGGAVHGKWPGVAESAREQGDLAGANDYRDVLAELLKARFNLGDTGEIFPGHRPKDLGVFR